MHAFSPIAKARMSDVWSSINDESPLHSAVKPSCVSERDSEYDEGKEEKKRNTEVHSSRNEDAYIHTHTYLVSSVVESNESINCV
jgi:hypothetical protein